MNIGTQILKIRKEKGLTQEEFGKIFHVTRQTVSNWENEKSYPDLQILIDISNRFDISLDVLIKEDVKMVKTMDKERVLGSLKREKSVIDFFTEILIRRSEKKITSHFMIWTASEPARHRRNLQIT